MPTVKALERTVKPSRMPTKRVVALMPEAMPARSRGAEPMMALEVSPLRMPPPAPMMTIASSATAGMWCHAPIPASALPAAVTDRPMASTISLEHRRPRRLPTLGNSSIAAANGSMPAPVAKALRPTPFCRYCGSIEAITCALTA
ncbi:hypothetical protein D3C72_1455860 [compost metagenome]